MNNNYLAERGFALESIDLFDLEVHPPANHWLSRLLAWVTAR